MVCSREAVRVQPGDGSGLGSWYGQLQVAAVVAQSLPDRTVRGGAGPRSENGSCYVMFFWVLVSGFFGGSSRCWLAAREEGMWRT